MRLIDADELREQCHTIPDPKGIYCGLDIIEKYEIDDAPTICDLKQIREDMENISVCDEYQFPRSPQWMKQAFIDIINKYINK